ncbi:hypothetical protein KKH27_10005 [bacterium]|nr:hypothetical protein [bacterium]MBU1984871.1 hypothetical protein [bacterium]
MDFNAVYNWPSAELADFLATGVALVNCPVVSVGDRRAVNPDFAPVVSVDRFSDAAAHLFRRSDNPMLPAPNAPINFDAGAPFITRGLGPSGHSVQYYNLDVQPTSPAPIYVLFRTGETSPVASQLNIIDVIPGDAGYNDFWRVHKVTVPANYVANTLTGYDQIMAEGYAIEPTTTLVNCPVVPDGSTASLRYAGESNQLHRGWYEGFVVKYFTFEEHPLMTDPSGMVPLSEILVTFNINPDQTGGGPPSGFRTEMGTDQTHNVVQTLPGDASYSPLWDVDVYDNMDFDAVSDWSSAMSAMTLAEGVATVNCPVVTVAP